MPWPLMPQNFANNYLNVSYLIQLLCIISYILGCGYRNLFYWLPSHMFHIVDFCTISTCFIMFRYFMYCRVTLHIFSSNFEFEINITTIIIMIIHHSPTIPLFTWHIWSISNFIVSDQHALLIVAKPRPAGQNEFLADTSLHQFCTKLGMVESLHW